MTIEQKKARIYDLMVERQRIDMEIQRLNQELASMPAESKVESNKK